MKKGLSTLLLIGGILLALIIGGFLASRSVTPNEDIDLSDSKTEDKIILTEEERLEAKAKVEDLLINVWDEESKKNEGVRRESEKNDRYQDVYSDIVVDEKMLDIGDLYELEDEYYDGGYNFNLKHPYNLIMAIEIASKHTDRTLEKFIFADESKVKDLTPIFNRDGNGNLQYFVNIKDNTVEYFKLDKKFAEMKYVRVGNSYMIDSIEKVKSE